MAAALRASPVCDIRSQAWRTLRQNFESLGAKFNADKGFNQEQQSLLANECTAAASVVQHVLDCQESDGRALNVVQQVFSKLSTLLDYAGQRAAYAKAPSEWLNLQASLEDICRLVPGPDAKKSPPSCATAGVGGGGFSDFQPLLAVEQLNGRLQQLRNSVTAEFGKVLFPADLNVQANNPGGLSDAVDEFNHVVQGVPQNQAQYPGARSVASSCDPQEVCDFLESLNNAASQMASAYDRAQCLLGQASCTIQSVSRAVIQDRLDEFGFFAAETLRAANRLQPVCAGLADQLKTVWSEMLGYLTGPVKRAFVKYEEQELCPPALCYDKATAALRTVIDRGLAQADALAPDADGCDESKYRQQRHWVDQAVQEITKLDCKRLRGFDACVWTRLGSFTMRLYAILGRRTALVANQVRTLGRSLGHLREWFFRGMQGDPPPDAVPFLRAGLGILRSLQDRAQSYGVCAELPSCCPDQGQMELQIVDENNQPLAGSRVKITMHSGEMWEANADVQGWIRQPAPKGPATVTPVSGAVFPVFTTVIQ